MFKKVLRFLGRTMIILILLITIFYSALVIILRPSLTRDWSEDQSILPFAVIDKNLVHVKNIRNNTYASTTSYTPAYYDKTYDIDKLKKVYFIVEPFSGYVGAAHTFLSFEFEDNVFVSISAEIRKEKGESFSALKGLLRQYELMYVIADERDVVKLRSNYRKDNVYVYPVNADLEKSKKLFLSMIQRANKLSMYPEYYNTLTNTCTTNIVSHVNTITSGRVPLNLAVLFPANSDRFAYDLGLIDTDLSFEKAREKFLINEKAFRYADDPLFSVKIRE